MTETKDDEENVAEVGRGERDEGRETRATEELGTVRCESRQRGNRGAAAHLYVRGADDPRDSKTRRTIDAPRRRLAPPPPSPGGTALGIGGVARRARATRDLAVRVFRRDSAPARPTERSRTFPPRLSPRTRGSARRRPLASFHAATSRATPPPRRGKIETPPRTRWDSPRIDSPTPQTLLRRDQDVLRVRREEQAEERHARHPIAAHASGSTARSPPRREGVSPR